MGEFDTMTIEERMELAEAWFKAGHDEVRRRGGQ
jgi:hypothetical protein